jgi:hypothetical protein
MTESSASVMAVRHRDGARARANAPNVAARRNGLASGVHTVALRAIDRAVVRGGGRFPRSGVVEVH